jgi:hypothetical protein
MALRLYRQVVSLASLFGLPAMSFILRIIKVYFVTLCELLIFRISHYFLSLIFRYVNGPFSKVHSDEECSVTGATDVSVNRSSPEDASIMAKLIVKPKNIYG